MEHNNYSMIPFIQAIRNNEKDEKGAQERLLHHDDRDCEQPARKPNCITSRYLHVVIIAIETILAAILILGYILVSQTHSPKPALDGLLNLNSYTTSSKFHNNSHLLRGSHEANTYWKTLLNSGGVVSLDTKWALSQGLSESATSPTDSSKSIYQVDVFHALHCMVSYTLRHFQPNRKSN